MPNAGVEQRWNELGEIIAVDLHIAVRDDQVLMTRDGHHIDEIVHLAIAAVLFAIRRQHQIEPRELSLQPVDHRNGGILRIADAKNHLISRISLLAKGAQTLVGLGLRAE